MNLQVGLYLCGHVVKVVDFHASVMFSGESRVDVAFGQEKEGSVEYVSLEGATSRRAEIVKDATDTNTVILSLQSRRVFLPLLP